MYVCMCVGLLTQVLSPHLKTGWYMRSSTAHLVRKRHVTHAAYPMPQALSRSRTHNTTKVANTIHNQSC